MLVLVLEFSKISATTLYPPPISGWEHRGMRGRERASFEGRPSKTEDESPDLRGSHLTVQCEVQVLGTGPDVKTT